MSEDKPIWAEKAESAVREAIDNATFDKQNHTITTPGGSTCRNVDELRQELERVADEEWVANVPFEDGEPVYPSQSEAIVERFFADRDLEAFFP